MQLVASPSFFRHFISRTLRLGVVVLALFTILLSSLAPTGVVLADDPVDQTGGVSAGDVASAAVAGAVNGASLAVTGIAQAYAGDKAISLLITALAAIYAAIGRAIGYLIPIVINILINVLNYNSFGDSFIVTIGWPIMRDLLNMSVILILLVIAIRTMVGIGGGAQGAQQAIGRVFFAVVLLNFSKTITLLLIDASQVVMLTFVNALDVATGNFVELFQINAILSTSWDVVGNIDLQADTPNAVGFLVNSFLSTFLLAIVLMTLVILAIVFVYRIVVLWMLVVLSPVAMFFYGLGDTLPGASGAVEEWRKRFVGALTIGPILSFFLWLSLAAASQGAAIAETEGFTFFENETANAFLEIFQPGKLLSLGLGIMLLVIGMQLAASSAASLGEFSGNLVAKLPGWSAKLAKMSSLGVGKFAGRQVELRTKVGQKTGSVIASYGAKMQGSAIPGGALVGSVVAGAGGRIENYAESISSDVRKQAQEAVKNYTSEQAAGMALAVEAGNDKSPLLTPRQKMEFDEFKKRFATDKAFAAKVKAALASQVQSKDKDADAARVEAVATQIDSEYVNMSDADRADHIGDDKAKRELDTKTRVAKAHLISGEGRTPEERAASRAKIIAKLIESPDFKMEHLTEEAMRDPDVMLALQRKTTGRGKDGQIITAFDEALAGARGTKTEVQEVARMWAERANYQAQIENNVSMDNTGRVAIMQPVAEQIRNERTVERERAKTSKEPYSDPLKRREDSYSAQGLSVQDVERLARAGKVPSSAQEVSANVSVVAEGLANVQISLDRLAEDIRGPIVKELEQQSKILASKHGEEADSAKEARILAAIASANNDTSKAIDSLGYTIDGGFKAADEDRVRASKQAVNIMVNNRPTQVYKLDEAIQEGSELAETIVNATSQKTLDSLKVAMRGAEKASDTKAMANIRSSIASIQKALSFRMRRLSTETDDKAKSERKRLVDLDRGLLKLSDFGADD